VSETIPDISFFDLISGEKIYKIVEENLLEKAGFRFLLWTLASVTCPDIAVSCIIPFTASSAS